MLLLVVEWVAKPLSDEYLRLIMHASHSTTKKPWVVDLSHLCTGTRRK
jgi:hypothetical protein